MKAFYAPLLLVAIFFMQAEAAPQQAEAGYRQYYSSWSYNPVRHYHYRTYYYKPTPTYTSYHHHYCVYRPSTPRYVYFYNPVRRQYWGRYDLEGQPGQEYSILKEEDRNGDLNAIPESAFPKPAQMPVVPEAEDGLQMEAPPKDLPSELPAN